MHSSQPQAVMRTITGIAAAPSETTIVGAMPVTRIVPASPMTKALHQLAVLGIPAPAYSSLSPCGAAASLAMRYLRSCSTYTARRAQTRRPARLTGTVEADNVGPSTIRHRDMARQDTDCRSNGFVSGGPGAGTRRGAILRPQVGTRQKGPLWRF